MDSIRLLDLPQMDRALRRYVLAQNLFDQACYAILDQEGRITPLTAILSTVDDEMAAASDALESEIQRIVEARVDEALKVARLFVPESLPKAA